MTDKTEKARRMELRRDSGYRPLPVKQVIPRGAEYRTAYACFSCRKSFKRVESDILQTCPNCKGQSFNMGRAFRTPKTTDTEQWAKVQKLYEHGYRFISTRSYPNAERFPEKLTEVDDFILRNSDHPARVKRPGDES